MTTDETRGMTVREVIARKMNELVFSDESFKAPDVQKYVKQDCHKMAQRILSALKEAGYVVVCDEDEIPF